MIKILLTSLLLLFTANAQNVWYVNFNNTSGTYNGQSWATAWRTLDAIWTKIDGSIYGVDWDVIGDGDTIYVSGGSDSTTYIAQNIIMSGYGAGAGQFIDPVVICPSWESGHNGDVYIVNTNHQKIAFSMSGLKNVKVTGFNVYHLPSNPLSDQQCAYITTSDSIVIDSSLFASDGSSTVITFADASYCTLSNSTVETLYNTFPCNQDLVGLTAGGSEIPGGNKLINLSLISRGQYAGTSGTADGAVTVTSNSLTDTRLSMVTDYHIAARVYCDGKSLDVTSNDGTTFTGTAGWSGGTPTTGQSWYVESNAHMDIIQIGGEQTYGDDSFATTVFDRLFIWAFSESFPYSNIIYANGTAKQRFIFSNNLVVIDVPTAHSPIALTDNEVGQVNRAWVFNNTFIVGAGTPIYFRPMDTLVYKNNIVLQHTYDPTFMFVLGYSNDIYNACYKDVDYNYYYKIGGTGSTEDDYFIGPSSGLRRTWTQWTATDGFDTHSDTGYISLADVRDSVISAFVPSEQLQGTDLSAYGITTDILGNERTVWTMGALEFIEAGDGIIRKVLPGNR